MKSYKCDACGSAVCWCHPSEDWGVAESCMYDVGVPVNWRVARPPRPKVKLKKKPKDKKSKECYFCKGSGEWYINEFSDGWGKCYVCKGTGVANEKKS